MHAYKKTGFLRTVYSIQANPKAMTLERPIVTTMNFRVSTAPHSLSKYLNDAGMTSNVKRS